MWSSMKKQGKGEGVKEDEGLVTMRLGEWAPMAVCASQEILSDK